MRGNFEKAIEGFEGFRIAPEIKLRLTEEEAPAWMLWFTEQTLFGPLTRRFGLPALQQHLSLIGDLGLWFLLLTCTPGQGWPQQADTQRHYDERMAYEARAHYKVRAHILSGQYCDNTAQ